MLKVERRISFPRVFVAGFWDWTECWGVSVVSETCVYTRHGVQLYRTEMQEKASDWTQLLPVPSEGCRAL